MKTENRSFEQTLHHGNFIVRDHHVHDVRTLPGVTLLDMIYRLAPGCVGSNAIELRRVVFKQPIVTSEHFDKKIQVTFKPIDSHWHVSVSSYKTKDNQPLDDVHYQNMECLLFPIDEQKPSREIDARKFIAESDCQVDMADIYRLVAQPVNIKHFTFMKTLGTVYCKGNAELMQLSLSDEAERFRQKFHAHPAFLDGSTFAGQSIRVRNPAMGEDNTPYIPFTIDCFCIYQPLPKTIYTYSENEAYWNSKESAAPDVVATDVAIFNEAGELLVEFKRFTMKRIRSAHLIKSLLEEAQSGRPQQSAPLHAPHRVPEKVAAADRSPDGAPERKTGSTTVASYIQEKIAGVLQQPVDEISLSDNFYDLGMDSTQLLWLTKELEEKIGKELYPTLLFEYSSIEKLAEYLGSELDAGALLSAASDAAGNGVSGRPSALQAESPEETERKVLLFVPFQDSQPLAALPEEIPARRHVLLVAGSRVSATYSAVQSAIKKSLNVDNVVVVHPVGEVIAAQIEDTLVQVVTFIKELVSQQATDDLLVQLVADSSAGHSWATMFSGCFKTLSMEHPRIRSQVILIVDLSAQSPDAITQVLQREAIAARKGATHTTYTGNLQQRYTSALRELDYQAPDAEVAFQDDGVYVIAGGLGGLGFIAAEHIATRSRAKLALLGRSRLGDDGHTKLDQLSKRGAEVLYLQTDLTDLTAVEDAFHAIREKFGRVTGILHSAGIIKDQVIGRKNIEDIRAVAGPKISGLWNLDQASRQDKIDFFMIFSSLSAITGNIGQVDYSCANSFMDAFARHRQDLTSRGQRSGDTISINWPLWAEGGMAIDKGVERLMYQSTGLHPLPTAVGLQVIDWALRHRMTQVAVAYGTENKIRNHIVSHAPALPVEKKASGEPLSAASPAGAARQEISTNSSADIAIIGLAGRYPQAGNIGEFYQNLKEGRNCISRVPKERWDNHDFGYDIDDYYKFGGFIDRIDMFDPLLFGLPPVRAQFIDPQARLFLETAWEACEDAGFYQDRTKQHYRGSGENSVGVFVGAFWSHYELFGSENTVRGVPTAMGVSLSSISNMTSYCMNFHGPSVAVDTMCSSALTSIHLACESIRRNECHYAIAGGVNLLTHPHKFIFLKENHFLSSEGICRSFGADGDGYVPGEGVGAVMLTTLERAISMGYPIRGVIKGSAINHCGKTAGGTVPNPVAQAEVIADALTVAAVDPRTVSYVEAHGTGTSLGDPIEIKGLTKAFSRWTEDTQYCAIGSSKSNIGHLEAAAGIAGLTKLLLQLEHGEIFPSLHAEKLNPLIPFQTTPFYVERSFRTWHRPEVEINEQKQVYPRRALISSFGASGSNASLVLEEFPGSARLRQAENIQSGKTVGIVLSARDANRLNEQARRLLTAIQQGDFTENDLSNIAYTLQVGREPMDERLAFAVKSLRELDQKLQSFVDGAATVEDLYRGRVKRNNPVGALYSSDDERKAEVDGWIVAEAYPALLKLWTEGLIIDWKRLYTDDKPRRMHLPTYPFARDRYWIPKAPAVQAVAPATEVAGTVVAKPMAATKAVTADLPNAGIAVVEKAEPAPRAPAAPVPVESRLAGNVRPLTALRSPGEASLYTSENRNSKKVALTPLAGFAAASIAVLPEATARHAQPGDSTLPAEVMPVREVPPLASIQQSLTDSLAKALFIEPSEIELDAPFTDFGLDSIIAVQWMKAINNEFKLSLKATILYEYSSIRALSENVASEMARPLQPPAETSTGETADRAAIAAAPDGDASGAGGVAPVAAAGEAVPMTAAATDVEDESDQLAAAPAAATQAAEIVDETAVAADVSGEAGNSPAATAASDQAGDVVVTLSATVSDIAGLAATTKRLLPSPVDVIKKSLIDSLAKTMFMEVHEIGEDVSFVEFGMDSIIAVQWIKAINLEFSSSLKATILYEHSTIESLAGHLHDALSRGDTEPSAASEEQAPARDMLPIDTQDGGPIQPAVRSAEDERLPAAELSDTASIQGSDVASAPASLRESLKRSLAKVLFVEASAIDEAAMFTEYGLDPIVATHWIKAVNAEYGTALKATVLLEHSSIDALVQYLSEQLVTVKRPSTLAGSQAAAARETPPLKNGTEQRQGGPAVAEASLANAAFLENFRYALTGCNREKIVLTEVSPGVHLEVFSIGQGDPVLLMSPMGALATVWMYQIRELSKKYQVLICHYPGHGGSGFVKESVTFDRIATDVLKIIDSFGIKEKLHLVGWSMGALISQKMALKRPEKIRSLTLISTPATVEQGDSLDSTITVLGNLVNDFVENVPSAAKGSPESRFEFIRASFLMDVTMPYLNETLNFDYGSAARISQETMIVFGEKDMVISPEHGAMLSDEIENARYFKHEEGGHYIPLQNHEWFNEKLIRFFSETEESANLKNTEMAE